MSATDDNQATNPAADLQNGVAVLQKVFGHKMSRLGVIQAVLIIMAHPVIAKMLVAHSESIGQLALDDEKWNDVPADKRLQALTHFSQILTSVEALLMGSSAKFAAIVDFANDRHGKATVELTESIGDWKARTYRANEQKLLSFVLDSVLVYCLDAYSQFVRKLSPVECENASIAVGTAYGTAFGVDNPTKSFVKRATNVRTTEGKLVVVPEAGRIAAKLIDSGTLPALLPDAEMDLVALIAGDLPEHIATGYGIGGNEVIERYLEECTRVRALMPTLPPEAVATPVTSSIA